MEYRVNWTIDVEAGTPKQAAKQALAIQRDPESAATAFDVHWIQQGARVAPYHRAVTIDVDCE